MCTHHPIVLPLKPLRVWYMYACNGRFMGGFNYAPIFCKRLPVFFKQRNYHFYPAWQFTLAGSLLRVPEHFLNATVWSIMVYFSVGEWGQAVCASRSLGMRALNTEEGAAVLVQMYCCTQHGHAH